MGHFRIKLVPAAEVARDVTMAVKMQRLAEPETINLVNGQRDFGQPPCISDWDGWNITSDQVTPVPGLPVSYFIAPTSASVLCDGECLEWSMETTCPGANVTITPTEDCVGVTLTFDDTFENLLECIATLNAVIAGTSTQFGTTINIQPFPDQTFLYSDEAAVIATDAESREVEFECGILWAGEVWILTSPEVGSYVPELFAWNFTQPGADFSVLEDTDGLGRPRISVAMQNPDDPSSVCGQEARADPTYNGVLVNGPLRWTFAA